MEEGIKNYSGALESSGVTDLMPDENLRRIVKKLAMINAPLDTITDIVNEILAASGLGRASEEIIRETFKPELKNSLSVALANVTSRLYENAIDKNDTAAQMFFIKHFSSKENVGALEEQNVVVMKEEVSCDDWTREQIKATKEKPGF